jgi:hypothetical protein
VILNASINVSGAIGSNLTILPSGEVAGTVHNGTDLDLQNPLVVAGQSVATLVNLPSGATERVHVQPSTSTSALGASSVWSGLYGGSDLSSGDGLGGFGFRDCCGQFSYPDESKTIDRERNAIAMFLQAEELATPDRPILVGWSQQPLESISVDGATPRQRDLTLVVAPLTLRFPSHGQFRMPAGTLEAHLVDILPRAPQSTGFGFGGPDGQQISVGVGGALTFEFQLPHDGIVRFRYLTLSTGLGVDSLGPARIYDWHTARWRPVDLSMGSASLANPNRFISPTGQLLVQVRATGETGDFTITDQYHVVELSAMGTVT